MTVLGTRNMMLAASQKTMQTRGTRRLLHAVFVQITLDPPSSSMKPLHPPSTITTTDLAWMLRAGMTLMERPMTVTGTTASHIIVPPSEIHMKTRGTRRVLHAVFVVVAVQFRSRVLAVVAHRTIRPDHPLVLHDSELDWIPVDIQTEQHVSAGSCQDCRPVMEHGTPPQIIQSPINNYDT